MSRAVLLALLAIPLFLIETAAARAEDVVEARAALYAQYGRQLQELADGCRGQHMPEAAAEVAGWLPRREPDQLTLFLLPPAAASDDAEWRARWQKLRNVQADALMELAQRSVAAGRPSIALELVTEAVRENPDHKAGRRILGYVRYRDEWHTPFEIRQLGGGKVWHEKFGWLPKSYVERYDAGQRYYQGRWMSAADEAELRSDLRRGWRVESEHYVVTTNHSLEEGDRLSRRLETLYGIWQQVFPTYVGGEAELARRLEGRAARREPRQHNVVYYRSRQEYNDALRSAQPQIEITLGIYFDSTRTAYFFAGEDQEAGTLYHEATHQLFQETRPVAPDVGRNNNFWVVEAVACYMESLAERDSHFTLGGMNAGRMPAARHRLLQDDFYVPLAQLLELGMESLQRDPRIARLYSQSSGLADFLMHDDRGRYRDALARYLDAVYSGRATTQTLAETTGASYESLDHRYRQFMDAGKTTAEQASPSIAR